MSHLRSTRCVGLSLQPPTSGPTIPTKHETRWGLTLQKRKNGLKINLKSGKIGKQTRERSAGGLGPTERQVRKSKTRKHVASPIATRAGRSKRKRVPGDCRGICRQELRGQGPITTNRLGEDGLEYAINFERHIALWGPEI